LQDEGSGYSLFEKGIPYYLKILNNVLLNVTVKELFKFYKVFWISPMLLYPML